MRSELCVVLLLICFCCSQRIGGYADFHIHQMAEFAYAGAWFPKGLGGAVSHKGDVEVALPRCSGGKIFGGDHARVKLPAISSFIGEKPGTKGDTGLHFAKRNGFQGGDDDFGRKTNLGWPRWDTIAHQQVWEGHLKQAHDKGLSVYFMSAVDFKILCDLMPKKNRRDGQTCGGMGSIDLQIQAVHDFVAERNWVELVRDPIELRKTVSSGKLAIVLAIELSDLFEGCEGTKCSWEDQLNKYYDWGVRSIQLVHELNNQFGGAAGHHWMFKLLQMINQKYDYHTDSKGRNLLGLTDLGKEVLQAMIDRNMFVDLAHLSERSIEDAINITTYNNYYPMIISHGFLRSMGLPDKQKETKTTPDWAIRYLKESCGMFGIRTDYFPVNTYGEVVPNDCDGSSKSFAQSFQYATLGLNLSLAMGTDFNGFIQQTRPRFGNINETCGGSGDDDTRITQQSVQTNKLGTEFDSAGLGHVGLVPDLLQEIKNFGVDTSPIWHSAENFAQLWERMYNQARSPCSIRGFHPLDPSSTSPNGLYTASTY